jgi:hypothetical protein
MLAAAILLSLSPVSANCDLACAMSRHHPAHKSTVTASAPAHCHAAEARESAPARGLAQVLSAAGPCGHYSCEKAALLISQKTLAARTQFHRLAVHMLAARLPADVVNSLSHAKVEVKQDSVSASHPSPFSLRI